MQMKEIQQNFVITGLQSWHIKIGSNAKNIAIELSKTHKVLYVNLPPKRVSFLKTKNSFVQRRKKIKKGSLPNLLNINDNLWVYDPNCILESINFLPRGKIYKWMNKVNNQRFANEIVKATKQLGYDSYYLLNDNCMFEGLYLKELLKPIKYIYYFRDDLTVQPYFKRHGLSSQSKIFRKADLVAANSRHLMDIAQKTGTNAIDVGQGCESNNFDIFHKTTKPKIFEKWNKNIVGYVGSLNSMRLDISLMEYIAKELPDMQFVLVGPEDQNFKKSNLHKMGNVTFMGLIPIAEVKNYLAYFDVCLNPQLINELTIGNYPIKIDEYLLMGKPVVATKTKAMEMFEEHVSLASNPDEFITYILSEIKNNTQEKIGKRVEFAKTHSWENSVNKILNCL